MPRKPIGDRASTNAERQALHRIRRAGDLLRYRAALLLIIDAETLEEARVIAAEALDTEREQLV